MHWVETSLQDAIVPDCAEQPSMVELNPFNSRSGGFLCDQTGQGKTRTMIEHIRRDWLTGHKLPTLVLVQPNIIIQWKRECAKWAPDMPIFVMYGNYRDNVATIASNRVGIVLSTPQTFCQYI